MIINQTSYADLRRYIRKLCAQFPNTYWQQLDAENAYPEAFVQAMTAAGYLAALIPEEYGGGGSTLTEASVILEEINRSGGNAAVCHAQMYIMGTLLRHGSPDKKHNIYPKLRRANYAYKLLASPNRMRAATQPASARLLCARATSM